MCPGSLRATSESRYREVPVPGFTPLFTALTPSPRHPLPFSSPIGRGGSPVVPVPRPTHPLTPVSGESPLGSPAVDVLSLVHCPLTRDSVWVGPGCTTLVIPHGPGKTFRRVVESRRTLPREGNFVIKEKNLGEDSFKRGRGRTTPGSLFRPPKQRTAGLDLWCA